MSWLNDVLNSTNSDIGNADLNAILQNLNISKQEFGNLTQIFNQLQPFFSSYLGSGSPLLNQVQSATTQNTSRQFAGAQGRAADQVKGSGFGSAPSGVGAG